MKRLNPFNGLQISLFDASYWTYSAGDMSRQRINSDLYFPGPISGLSVYPSLTTGYVAVTPGTAYDINGERISLLSTQDLIGYNSAKFSNVAGTYKIVGRYSEGNDGTYGVDINGACQIRHITDTFQIVTLKTGLDIVGPNDVILAGVITTIQGGSLIMDPGPRSIFGSKFPATGTGPSVALGQVLSGDLSVGGSISVGNNLTVTANETITGGLTVAGTITGVNETLTGNLTVNNLTVNNNETINGSLTVASETITGNLTAGSIDGGCMVHGTYLWGSSNLATLGDFTALSPGSGLLLLSPDRTKLARVFLGNNGYLQVDGLNYTLT